MAWRPRPCRAACASHVRVKAGALRHGQPPNRREPLRSRGILGWLSLARGKLSLADQRYHGLARPSAALSVSAEPVCRVVAVDGSDAGSCAVVVLGDDDPPSHRRCLRPTAAGSARPGYGAGGRAGEAVGSTALWCCGPKQRRQLRGAGGREQEFAQEFAVADLEVGDRLAAGPGMGPLVQGGEQLIDRGTGGAYDAQRPGRGGPGHAARSRLAAARRMAWSRVLRLTPRRSAAWVRV